MRSLHAGRTKDTHSEDFHAEENRGRRLFYHVIRRGRGVAHIEAGEVKT
jgi:hypothetical protein